MPKPTVYSAVRNELKCGSCSVGNYVLCPQVTLSHGAYSQLSPEERTEWISLIGFSNNHECPYFRPKPTPNVPEPTSYRAVVPSDANIQSRIFDILTTFEMLGDSISLENLVDSPPHERGVGGEITYGYTVRISGVAQIYVKIYEHYSTSSDDHFDQGFSPTEVTISRSDPIDNNLTHLFYALQVLLKRHAKEFSPITQP